MVHTKYSPKESLERIELLMKYDSSKTLTENLNTTNQNNTTTTGNQADAIEYFKKIAESIMKYPDKYSINVGQPTINPSKNAAAFYKAIKGLGRDRDGLKYIISKSFDTIANSIAFIKAYPSVGEESLYEAIDGQWFAGNLMENIVGLVSQQLQQWCSSTSNKSKGICTVRTKEQLKYGI
jgi:hypothetical protein